MQIEKICKDDLRKFKELIDQSESIAISAHINPDGDALGSSLATRRVLESLGKKVDVIKLNDVDDYLQFMPDLEYYKDHEEKDYDLFIVLDCSEFDRLGKAENILKRSKKSVVIDHHMKGKITSDLNMIFSNKPATCQILFEIFDSLGFEIDEITANLLFTGIVTDTGRFMYSNTRSDTFEIASKLLEKGVDHQYIYKNLYQNKPIEKMKFEANILQNVKYFDDKAFVPISKAICEKFSVQMGDSESIVNMLRDLKGIELSCILKEYGKREYKVSLRSKDRIDVSKIARENGGGGHERAAGFTITTETMEEAEKIILDILKSVKWFREF